MRPWLSENGYHKVNSQILSVSTLCYSACINSIQIFSACFHSLKLQYLTPLFPPSLSMGICKGLSLQTTTFQRCVWTTTLHLFIFFLCALQRCVCTTRLHCDSNCWWENCWIYTFDTFFFWQVINKALWVEVVQIILKDA